MSHSTYWAVSDRSRPSSTVYKYIVEEGSVAWHALQILASCGSGIDMVWLANQLYHVPLVGGVGKDQAYALVREGFVPCRVSI